LSREAAGSAVARENVIGRFAGAGVAADIGGRRVATVAAAAALLVAGGVADAAGYRRAGAVLALASLSLTGLPIVWRAVRGLARFESNVDELVSLAIVASLLLGEWASAAIVAFIMVLGSLIEAFVSARARRHLEALVAAQPRHALRLSDDGGVHQVPIADLRPGDRILVRPGDVIAADGQVEDGESQVDESLLTGESAPADRGPGDLVSGGTINESGSLTVRVRRVGEESAHGKVLRLIREAESHRAPILRAAEAYARWFTPGVLTLAGVVWVATGDVQRAVTMLIVGCPCAFVLATPTAIVAAMSRAAREGLLLKGGRYVEGCARVAAIAFDKTGTLTKGECRVVDVIPCEGGTQAGLLAAAARLEAAADHPLARAIQSRAAADGVVVSESLAILREAGLGITGRTGDASEVWRLGNARFMARHGIDVGPLESSAERLRARGLSIVYVARGDHAKGLLSIEDEVRPEARDVIAELRADGLREVSILSGDARAVALAVAADVGVEAADVVAELLPEQKYECVQDLERRHGRLCYVGDGANDGPALSVATVGVSLGSRHDTVALETAAVVLMRNSLSALPFLFRLSRRTTRTINQNLVLFGLMFNAAMLALSSAGVLTPILGALAHNVGSISVVINSARLLLFERARGRAGSARLP
jgi:Zn2+/Cd2+-exporting ATPase